MVSCGFVFVLGLVLGTGWGMVRLGFVRILFICVWCLLLFLRGTALGSGCHSVPFVSGVSWSVALWPADHGGFHKTVKKTDNLSDMIRPSSTLSRWNKTHFFPSGPAVVLSLLFISVLSYFLHFIFL